ncbi:MAG: hypothetical protein MUE66_01035 [Acidimicrobiia bacterium]|nr:hypothetical protein [Acidimicrobiia bacterium]
MNAFSLAGLVMDGIGMALIIAGVITGGEARWGLVITGASVSVAGAVMYLSGRKVGSFSGVAPRLLRAGLPARALVERMWETGVTINESPVFGFGLQVTREGEEAYSAEVQQAVPRMLVGAVLPGATLAVKVDPADPARVAIDWSAPPAAANLSALAAAAPPEEVAEALRALPPEQRGSAAELLARGRRGTARLVGIRDMGDAVELGLMAADDERAGARVALLELEVKLPGKEPYRAQVIHWLPARLEGRVGPGRTLVVAVGRDDPEHEVAVDWEAAAE